MIEEIDLGGIKVPAADWESTPESIKLVLMFLLEERKQMKEKIEEMEEKLNKNSRNSSIPPSKNGFATNVKSKVKSKKKPLKMQALRKRPEKKLYSPEECVACHEEKPAACNSCGYELSGEDAQPYRHQVVELPVLNPYVTEYRLHELECEHCGEKTRAALPEGVSPKSYGVRLAAFVAMMGSENRQSYRQLQRLLSQAFRIEKSRGTINEMKNEVSMAIEKPVAEAMVYAQQQRASNSDETGFKQQNKDGRNPSNKKAWLWVMVTPLVSVFMVTLSRGQEAAKQLLGGFTGFLGSDRCECYSWVDVEKRQVCWSHLLRDFQAMAERQGASKEIGEALLARGYRLFHWWHRVKDGKMSKEQFREAVRLLRAGIRQELELTAGMELGKGEKTPHAKTVRTCRKLLKVEKAMWTFVYHEGVEPTNNSAERALRTAVIWRSLSFGSQSEEGSNFVARMLTVNTSLKAQGRSILDFLTESVQAARLGMEYPSLIPTIDNDSTPATETLLLR
jgi:transposase